jgi:hypothetical protein
MMNINGTEYNNFLKINFFKRLEHGCGGETPPTPLLMGLYPTGPPALDPVFFSGLRPLTPTGATAPRPHPGAVAPDPAHVFTLLVPRWLLLSLYLFQ